MSSKELSPKEFVMLTFKQGNGKRITEVLRRYYKYVNYYKEKDVVQEAIEVFKTS